MRTDYVVLMRRNAVASPEVVAVYDEISDAGKYVSDATMAQCVDPHGCCGHTFYIVKVDTK